MAKITNIIRKARCCLIRLLMSRRSLTSLPSVAFIFAPHPDDEVFGCCGLMQRMVSEGRRVELIIMTGGGKSHSSCCDIDEHLLISERRKLTLKAAQLYGLPKEHIHFLNYPDGGIIYNHAETSRLKELMKSLSPSSDLSVFSPHQKGEGWNDHQETGRIAMELTNEICPSATQYEYCVWFWFYGCMKVDLTNAYSLRLSDREHAIKQSAINTYMEPKAPCGNPYSGVLPKVFLWAMEWNKELFFKR